MTQSPYTHALLAIAYILLVASSVTALARATEGRDNFMTPVLVLSLLVLSVSVMAFLFFYRPVVLLLDGKRREAVSFFARTVLAFAACVVIVFCATLLISLAM